jgi:hypothetical protein
LDTREVTRELVEQGYEAAYRGDVPLLDQLIEEIRSLHKRGLLMARRVAEQQTLSGGGVHPGDADRALKKLMDAGIAARTARGRYRIVNPLLRRHLIEQRFR